jgi:NAD(P)-dependent dehydrogenase (short-subunit alcohol dehydrogenase family)
MTDLFLKDLKNKICVITGGGGVIGSDLTLHLSRLGLQIAIVDYKKDRCDACAEKLSQYAGKKITCVVANVLDKKQLIQGKQLINKNLGKIDILINAAGGNAPEATTDVEYASKNEVGDLSKTFFGLDIEGFQSIFNLNFIGTLLPTMIFAEDMVEKGGVILNVSSLSAIRPLTKVPAYSTAKSSINNFTYWLAVHLAKLNIRVNAIAPGFLLTNQNKFLLIDKKSNQLTARGKKIIAHTPMERFGDTEDLFGAVLFLISDMSKFVTGAILPIDGGFNAYSGV